ncbi:MAG: hypothetical protein ACE3L7_32400 [Candidatus Pristimantibacillus sp.]
MFKRDQVLVHSVDFDNAVFFQVPIEVFMNDGKYLEAGTLQAHSENGVLLNNEGRYLKSNCTFKIGYLHQSSSLK